MILHFTTARIRRCFRAGLWLASLGLVLAPGAARAGSGRFVDGRFDLFVTLSTDATANQIAEIQERFTQASELLFDATDGQARFGKVTVFNDNTGLEFADILITMTGTGMTNAGGTNLGLFGSSLDLFYDDDISGTPQDDAWQTIAHEVAHYAFNIKDEYTGPGGNAECITDQPATACLMSNYKNPGLDYVSEFCWAGNHDPDGDTGQTALNGESCWETIRRGYPTFGAPAGAPTEDPPGGFVAPDFQVVSDPRVRVVLVLDTSGSMAGAGGVSPGVTRIQDLNNFARQFIDLMGLGDVELGIVTYSSTATDPFPVALLNNAATVTAAKGALPAVAGGNTNIGGGLALGRSLAAAGAAPGPLILILMTDGYHNWPPGDASAEPLAVLPSVVAEDIHVHTVALGSSTNEALLGQIAKESGGIFWKANDSVAFEPVFSSFAALVRGGSLLDSPQRQTLAPGDSHVTPATGLQPPVPVPTGTTRRTLLRPVFVEKGSREATFNLGWSAAGARLELYLVSPSGKPIRPQDVRAGLVPNVRLLEGQRYRSYVVRSPESGLWRFGVAAAANPGGTTYVLQPTVLNPQVRAFAAARKVDTGPGTAPVIRLTAVARDRIPVTRIAVQARMTDPAGATSVVQLWDDGSPAHGDDHAADGTYSALVTPARNGVHHFDVTLRAAGATAVVIQGDEPPPGPDNRALYSVRDFWRSFVVDVPVTELSGPPPPRDPGDNPVSTPGAK